MANVTLHYPLFDGRNVYESATVNIKNDKIATITSPSEEQVDNNFLLMPGLIDAHTHMGTESHVKAMLQNGITATCDVSAPATLVEDSTKLNIISSAGMAMGFVLNGKNYVEKAIKNGAKYIKVLLFDTNTIGRRTLQAIVSTAHQNGLKVAAHATAVGTVQLAVDCGVDILIHVPMKEPFPELLAKTIAEKRIVVAPTLVMMETFANSGRSGYQPADYINAENAVRLLHHYGVTILVATDSNSGFFSPAVEYGTSLHREMELLVKAGLTPLEVLQGTTSKIAKTFGIENVGVIAPEHSATMILVKGRPDKEITDSTKIAQVWVNGIPIFL